MRALDRLEVREISPRFMSEDERIVDGAATTLTSPGGLDCARAL